MVYRILFLLVLIFSLNCCAGVDGDTSNIPSILPDDTNTWQRDDALSLSVELENNKVYRDIPFYFTGVASAEIVKVRIFFGAKIIGESRLKQGKFRIKYTFGELAVATPLLVVGYDDAGTNVAEKSYRLTVLNPDDVPDDIDWDGQIKLLSLPENIRYLKKNILEVAAEIPEGTVLGMDNVFKLVFNRYRTGIGIKTSKYGFVKNVFILTVPDKYKPDWPESRIEKLNAKGLYFSKSTTDATMEAPRNPVKRKYLIDKIVKEYEGSTDGDKLYRKSWLYSYKKRFPNSIQVVKDLSPKMKKLWVELQRGAKEWGYLQSLKEEDLLNSYTYQALKTALKTAQDLGYADRFCAEFTSEFVRQAYRRANLGEFTGTPLVTNLNKELNKFGWVVWDPTLYYPPPGAVGMNTVGISPSHTYIIAGMPDEVPFGEDLGIELDGYFMWDSSKFTKGVNIHKQTQKQVDFMYNTGGFWLPAGVIPKKRLF
jgi:hypothetical protein